VYLPGRLDKTYAHSLLERTYTGFSPKGYQVDHKNEYPVIRIVKAIRGLSGLYHLGTRGRKMRG